MRRKNGRSSKDGPRLPKVPQNSAGPLGFCRKVLQNVSHSEKACWRKVLQNPKGSAELWEPSPAFQALQFLLPITPGSCTQRGFVLCEMTWFYLLSAFYGDAPF